MSPTAQEIAILIHNLTGPCLTTDRVIAHWRLDYEMRVEGSTKIGLVIAPYTSSVDTAMTLLPATAVNIDMFSHTRDGGNGVWSCKFLDKAQKMGERAATEEIARLRRSSKVFEGLRGEALVVMEKAIAEHYLEFYATERTLPLAIIAAALSSKVSK